MDDIKRAGDAITTARMSIDNREGNPYQALVKAYQADRELLLSRLTDTRTTRENEAAFTSQVAASQKRIDHAYAELDRTVRDMIGGGQIKSLAKLTPADTEMVLGGLLNNAKGDGMLLAQKASEAMVTEAERDAGMTLTVTSRGDWTDAVKARTAKAIVGGELPRQDIRTQK